MQIMRILLILSCFTALYVYIATKSIPFVNTSDLGQPAFCKVRDVFDNQRYFPVEVPEHHLPWIWEAIHDPVTSIVELTTMNRIPCRFDHKQWKTLQKMFPKHLSQLAYGLTSNILVPVEPDISLDEEYFISDTVVECQYISYPRYKVVFVTNSLEIRGKKPYTSFSTLQIRCPAPSSHIQWNRIRIKIPDNRTQYLTKIFSNVTAAVPVCHLPVYNPIKKKYNMSVCTATNRANRSHLVEWIEYHLLAGIEHFYIYNTALDDRNAVNIALQDYIAEGKVTVIAWHYRNCVRNMASGRWNSYVKDGKTEFFQAPKAVAQQGALSSCYSRFKHTTKYMIHIDDDEFLSFSPEEIAKSYNIKGISNLLTFAEKMFEYSPRSTSIRAEPILFWPCNVTKGIENLPFNAFEYPEDVRARGQAYTSTPLPRLGVWDLSEISLESYESKLIMRTDAVGMFYVHFVSLIEIGPWERPRLTTSLTLNVTHFAVLHYKTPPSVVKNVVEGRIPFEDHTLEKDCSWWEHNRHKGKVYYAQISQSISKSLKSNYVTRMNQFNTSSL